MTDLTKPVTRRLDGQVFEFSPAGLRVRVSRSRKWWGPIPLDRVFAFVEVTAAMAEADDLIRSRRKNRRRNSLKVGI